jgi:two-component system, OmpR family, response regulator VicR
MKAKILYVEDDANLSFVTKDNLEINDYEIIHCADGQSAWETFQQQHVDLCILDVMLPQLDGFTLGQRIRNIDSQVPIMFLTARNMQEDKLQGLRLGADDYLTKPFSIEELVLRIEVFLRRSSKTIKPTIAKSDVIAIGIYQFNFEKLEITHQDHRQKLTYREAEVLRYLAERPQQVIKREEMLKSIWGDDDYFMGRSLDVFLSRLRKFLSQDPNIRIEAVHGVGFRMKC